MQLTVLSVAYPLAPVSEATAGGAEQILLSLDRGLVRHGHRSMVLAAAGSGCRGLLIPVQVPSGMLDESVRREACRQFRSAVHRAIDEFKPDIVHMHGFDFHQYLPDRELPVVVSLHLPLHWYTPNSLANRNNVSLVCVSNSQASTAPAGIRIRWTIPNGVDLDRFRPGKKSDYVLFMGRICPEKGLHKALAAAELAAKKLLIAGTVFEYREHRDYFNDLIRPRLGSKAIFLGKVGGKQKAALLAGATCLLVPSLAPETSSLIGMEALASGTPVVAWRSGALPEIVSENRTGFLVSSIEEMAEAILRAAELSSQTCRREAESRFSADRMLSSYLQVYQTAVNKDALATFQAA